MAAEFTLMNLDDETILSLDLGVIAPGEDYITKHDGPAQFKVVNTGTEDFSSVLVGLLAAGGFDSASKAEWAIGQDPAYPGDYNDLGDGHIGVGALAVDAELVISLQVAEPVDAVPEQNKVFRVRVEANE